MTTAMQMRHRAYKKLKTSDRRTSPLSLTCISEPAVNTERGKGDIPSRPQVREIEAVEKLAGFAGDSS